MKKGQIVYGRYAPPAGLSADTMLTPFMSGPYPWEVMREDLQHQGHWRLKPKTLPDKNRFNISSMFFIQTEPVQTLGEVLAEPAPRKPVNGEWVDISASLSAKLKTQKLLDTLVRQKEEEEEESCERVRMISSSRTLKQLLKDQRDAIDALLHLL